MDSAFRDPLADSPVFGLARAAVLGRRALDLSHLALAGTVLGADDGQKLFFLNSSEFTFPSFSRCFSRNGPTSGDTARCDNVCLVGGGLREVTRIRQFSEFQSLLLFLRSI